MGTSLAVLNSGHSWWRHGRLGNSACGFGFGGILTEELLGGHTVDDRNPA